MRLMIVAAALALTACDSGGDGVMREIQRAEKAEADEVEPAQTLPSGLEIQFRRRGPDQSLPTPTGNAMVRVHYEGSFVEGGEVFDSSFQRNEPADFPLGAVVPGFSEAITHMRPGDELVATFPGNLGYGAEGRPPEIPPNAALRFRIQLIMFQEPGGQIVGAPQ
jgi:FKBP-type peptidyl-prolyl cis-trans isomerase